MQIDLIKGETTCFDIVVKVFYPLNEVFKYSYYVIGTRIFTSNSAFV